MITRLTDSRWKFMRNEIGAAASAAILIVLIAVTAFVVMAAHGMR
jgi:hypothetical protein